MTMTTDFEPRHLRAAMGSFTTGVTVITACTATGERFGMTANSLASVSLNPPLLLWCVGLSTPSFENFRDCTHYTVNILSAEQEAISNRFANASDNKFAGLEWSPGRGGAPVLTGCVASFECANEMQYPGGDHLIMVGKIENYTLNGGEPLLYFGSSYARLNK